MPQRLSRRLVALGHDAIHVADIGLASAEDAVVWDAALARGAILVTKDQDFAIARGLRNEGPAIVWVRIGNSSNDALIGRVTDALVAIEVALGRGETIIELVGRQ